MTNKDLKHKIFLLKAQKSITFTKMADEIGIGASVFTRWRQGVNSHPDTITAIRDYVSKNPIHDDGSITMVSEPDTTLILRISELEKTLATRDECIRCLEAEVARQHEIILTSMPRGGGGDVPPTIAPVVPVSPGGGVGRGGVAIPLPARRGKGVVS